MKSPILFTTLLTTTLTSAAITPPGIGTPIPIPIPGCGGCGVLVDSAIQAAVNATKGLLGSLGYRELDDAIRDATICFKHGINCGPPLPHDSIREPGERDCSRAVEPAATRAVAELRRVLGACAPPGFEEGAAAGVMCFMRTLGCKPADAAA